MAKILTMDEMAKQLAQEALDNFLYDGKSLREWMRIIASKEMCEALTIAVKSIKTLSNIINIMENTSPYEVESEIENALENFKEYVEAE